MRQRRRRGPARPGVTGPVSVDGTGCADRNIERPKAALKRFTTLAALAELRAKVLARRRKARLGDALIAQCCIDHGIPLLTRDRDFRAFAEAASLDLVIGSTAD
jgi:predicted nucleic acid-binding protein